MVNESPDADLDQAHAEWVVVRCQLGERDAFDDLVARWHGPLVTFVRRMGADEDTARDVVQDTWIRVLRGIARLRDPGRVRAWLFGIARRVLMDRWRTHYATPAVADVDLALLPAGDDDLHDREGDLTAMEAGLSRLPLVEREVLTLFYLEQLPLADVAEVLGVPAGTVKSRLFRARRLLRQGLATEGPQA